MMEMEREMGGGEQASRGVGEGEVRLRNNFIGVSCLQLSLLTMDQNIVFPVPFIIPVVRKDRIKKIMML